MESNWRWNVWLFGLGATRCQLAARSPIPINPNRVIWVEPGGPFGRIVRASTLVGGYAVGGVFQNFVAARGFPYGYPVEPDH